MRPHKPLLEELVDKGKPLAEVVVVVSDKAEKEDVCNIFNALAPDVSAEILPAYFQSCEGDLRYELRLDTTKEFLWREFGWKLERVKVYDSSEHNGKFPDGYAWNEINKPTLTPSLLKGKVDDLGLTQPGKGDNGLIDNIDYDIES